MPTNNNVQNLPVDVIMNTVLDGLITIDMDGNIQSFNHAAERIFQYSPEEVLGKNVKILMPEPYHSEHDQYLINYLTTGTEKVIGIGREVSAQRKDGTVFPMELGVNEMDVDGQRMFVGTIRDITDRKHAEQALLAEKNHLQAVLNTALDGLLTIDKKGTVLSFNPAAERIFGYTQNEVIGKNVKCLMPEPYHSEHDQYLKNYLTTGEKKIIGIGREVSAMRKDGTVFPMELGVNEMDVDGKRMFVGTIRDITERKKEQDVLNQLYIKNLDTNLSLGKKIADILELGLCYFDLELGIVSKISGNEYKILYCTQDNELQAGQVFPLKNTYCSHVYGTNEVKAWSDAGNSEICHHPCYQDFKLDTYIGTTIFIDNIAFGTLSFIQKTPRSIPFSEREKAFLQLIAQRISSEIALDNNLAQIENARTFLQLIQDTIPDFIFVKDEQFRIVRANPAFLNVYPESMRDSIIGTTTLESYNQQEAEEFLKYDKLALTEGFSETEETIQFPDGQQRTLFTTKIAFNDQKNHRFILGIGRDITDIKKARTQLQESEARFEMAVEGSNTGIWTYDIKKNIFYISPKFRELLGYDGQDTDDFPHQLESWISRIHIEDSIQVSEAFEKHLSDHKPFDIEYRIYKKDGRFIWAHSRGKAQRDKNGKASHMAGSFEDITTRKNATEELLRANQDLERFAYMASHDLQEPLRMVNNFTGLLAKRYADQLDDKAQQYIQFACDGATNMQRLVRDLLEYARIGNEAEDYEIIELNQLKSSILERLKSVIDDTQATIDWDDLPTIRANPSRMCSVFQNLIGNAIKYRKPDIKPIVSISVASASEQWIFNICDNGIGMKQEYCSKIFEPFKRLHRREQYAGTGMGLSICRKTIEDLGGKIWAISELEKGSTFYFTLPKNDNNV